MEEMTSALTLLLSSAATVDRSLAASGTAIPNMRPAASSSTQRKLEYPSTR